ncbi:MAG: sodium/solute symporter [Opitutales bacterium]|nr:sodium/solute symporter [Opitutales bacterium]
MLFSSLDIAIFIGFIALVLFVGLYMGRSKQKEENAEGYFLAGRGLSWWLIGFSLIAANISTEQFVGMSGSAAGPAGLAIASYEWMAAITLVFVAIFFLPKFLKCGIYTMPQFLEQRFDTFSRTAMSMLMVVVLVAVNVTAVIYSGAITASTLFQGHSIFGVPMNLTFFAWAIGLVAAAYVFVGGLKACAWADLIQGAALIAGGAVIAYLAFDAMGAIEVEKIAHTGSADALKNLTDASGGIEKFAAANADKLTMFLPADNSEVPWTALIIGLWIPNFYYWGLNQYIMQRTLGASSLAEGQKGIMFAAFMKILIPFLIVFPGLIAFNLYSDKMADEALKDEKIQAANAEGYSLIFAAEKLGKFKSFDEIDPATLAKEAEIFAAEAKGISAEDAKKCFREYFELRAENELKDIRFAYDPAWAKQNPGLVKSVDAWNAMMSEKNPNLKNPTLKSQLLGKVETRTLAGYKYDTSFGFLLKELVPANGLTGFIFAALLGAVVSSLASMLNAASTIFTIDIFKRFIKKDASDKAQVLSGRICVALFAISGCALAPFLDSPALGNIFTYIQEFQGFLSPGILAVFLFGLFSKKAPRFAGAAGIVASPAIYGALKIFLPEVAFLNRMAITFAAILALMLLMTLIKPLKQEIELPENPKIDIRHSKAVYAMGAAILVITSSLYVYFS